MPEFNAILTRVSDLQPGDMVDLEGDEYADENGDPILESEYAVVESVQRETPQFVCVYFLDLPACGFPPDHMVCVCGHINLDDEDREMIKVSEIREHVEFTKRMLGLSLAESERRDLLKLVDECREALVFSLEEMKESADAIGGCDHSVGICCCELYRRIDIVSELLEKISA